MIKAGLLAAVVVGLAGCNGDKAAPIPGGTWQVLNAGQWDVNPSLVQAPTMPKAPN